MRSNRTLVCCCLVAKLCPALWRLHVMQLARLLCPWYFSGKNTGVGCLFLLQGFPWVSQPRNQTRVSCIGRQVLYHWATREALGPWSFQFIRSVISDSLGPHEPGFPVHHQLLEFTQIHAHWVSDAIQPSNPLSSLSPPAFNLFEHQGLFQWVSSLHQVAKVLEFQLQQQSFQWVFRTDFL